MMVSASNKDASRVVLFSKQVQDQEESEKNLSCIIKSMEEMKTTSEENDLTISMSTVSTSFSDLNDSDNMMEDNTAFFTKTSETPLMELEIEEEPEGTFDASDRETVASEPEDCARLEELQDFKEEEETPELNDESTVEEEEEEQDDFSHSNCSTASPKRHFFLAKAEDAAQRAAGVSASPPPSGRHNKVHTLTHQDSILVGLDRAPPTPSRMKRLSTRRSILKSSSSISSTTSLTPKSKIKFNSVVIREYTMTIGDHPNCSIGPPVSLDWEYEEFHPLDIDEYETARGQRRSLRQMLLNYYHRTNLFENVLEFSKEDIKAATRGVARTKRQREVTRAFLPVRKVEEVAQSATRKFKRVVIKKKTTTTVDRIEAPVSAY